MYYTVACGELDEYVCSFYVPKPGTLAVNSVRMALYFGKAPIFVL